MMNQLFYVEELVRQIAFSAGESPAGSASLLALACCCKILEGPVMDILWQRQKFLSIILKTLPVGCWTIADMVYRLIRTPTADEWERFRIYTGRVIELRVEGVLGEEVSSQTISFLGIQSTIDPLWPRLTSLRLTNRLGWDSVVSTLAFLSPKIKTLTLILPRSTSILLQPILSTASDRCRWVQELVLDVVVDDPDSARWVGGFISACRDTLRTLEVHSPFKAEYLPIILNLPQLRRLRLDWAHFPSDLPFDAFPALEWFTFRHFQGHSLQHFLGRLCTTRLKVAQIYSADDIDIKKSVAALCRFSNSLKCLEISAVTGLDLLRFSAARPLFLNLKNLHLWCFGKGGTSHGVCAFQPSDQAIVELGTSMPNLINLTLGSPTCVNLQCVTFLSLVSLSKTCRDLERLRIKVDFETMITLSLSTAEGFGTNAVSDETFGNGCRLHKLVVGTSTLPDHPDSGWLVAAGLGKIFPSLSEVKGYGAERSKWGQVERNIKMSRQALCSEV